jgi:hypothetical protein
MDRIADIMLSVFGTSSDGTDAPAPMPPILNPSSFILNSNASLVNYKTRTDAANAVPVFCAL